MKIDVVVLALNRNLFNNLMDSFCEYVNYDGFCLRLILHVDYHEMFDSYLNMSKDIEKWSKLFYDKEILIERENVGHTQSFYWCLLQAQNNVLYLEDDKEFYKEVKLSDIINHKYDVVSLEGNRGAKGNTSANYYPKESMSFLLSHYPPKDKWGDTERINKYIFKTYSPKFTYARNSFCVVRDMGCRDLADKGLIRRRRDSTHSIPIYMPVPKEIGYITNYRSEDEFKFFSYLYYWDFYLCLHSFPLQSIFDNYIYTINLETEHIGIITTNVKPYVDCTHRLDYDDIKQYDAYGNELIWYVKKKILNGYLERGFDNIIHIRNVVFKNRHLNIKYVEAKKMGFNKKGET